MTLVATKRVAACSVMLGAGFALGGMGGCGPQSPVVGAEEGSGSSPGSVELIGSATYFVNTLIVGDPEQLAAACLPRALPVATDGSVSCNVFTARYAAAAGECQCDGPARVPTIPPAREVAVEQLELRSVCGPGTGRDCNDYCVCQELPAVDASADDCMNNLTVDDSSFGWCYLDPDHGRGAPNLVANCPDTQKRLLRVLPDQVIRERPDTVWIIACLGGTILLGPTPPGPGDLGAPCLPGAERTHDFNGFQLSEVGFEFGSPDCQSNTCLINHFQGRVSCPYGQTNEELLAGSPACFREGRDGQVTVPVDPQLMERRADDSAICSCRCRGRDPSESYCVCPSGMECTPLVEESGIPSSGAYVGSYCIPAGTRYDPRHPPSPEICNKETMTCGDPRPY
jgi:hypothetical protein